MLLASTSLWHIPPYKIPPFPIKLLRRWGCYGRKPAITPKVNYCLPNLPDAWGHQGRRRARQMGMDAMHFQSQHVYLTNIYSIQNMTTFSVSLLFGRMGLEWQKA